MARTNSTYAASPTRWRSPHRSPARSSASAEGSQYQMDLDALGMNSTFDSTELSGKNEPKVDALDTSEIEGPEDFTMNMTYWMTADLPLTKQIRSRKEARVTIAEIRGDAQEGMEEARDTTADITAGEDKAGIEERSGDREISAHLDSPSPTVLANFATNARSSSRAPSEASMENEEKVRSYLSALPDTEIGEDAITSTPLRIPRQNMLQVPSPAAPKTQSLQATVEDYDTPRKPTQETVIHHPHERTLEAVKNGLLKQIVELQSRLERHESESKTRNTELETILTYTRSELEAARSKSYKQKERIESAQQETDWHKEELETSRARGESRLKAQEGEFNTRMQEFGEELRLQNLAKVQNQREDFERQVRILEEAKRVADNGMAEQAQLVEQHRLMMNELQQSHEQELRKVKDLALAVRPEKEQEAMKDHMDMLEKLSSLQSRADSLQTDLETATTEARSAREEAQSQAKLRASAQATNQAQDACIADLESTLESLRSQLNSARMEVAGKDQWMQDTTNNHSNIQSLQEQLNVSRAEVARIHHQLHQSIHLESRLQSLQVQLDLARSDVAAKDKQILQHIEQQESYGQLSGSAQGRIESLESSISVFRQQLAEAHRDNARAKSDAEQLGNNLEDATDRLQDARVATDRRVADVEKKLAKLKEAKLDAESDLKKQQSEYDEMVENHDAKLESVRDKAEDAVRKAGLLLEQERSERRRISKELQRTSHDLEQLRAKTTQQTAGDEDSSADESSMLSSLHQDARDTEIEHLRTLLRKQVSTLKTLKSEATSLRKANAHLKLTTASEQTITILQAQLTSLREENAKLNAIAASREADFEAINSAMDDRLAVMLNKAIKERTRNVIGKRDGQWAESLGEKNKERELMGRMLLREWGRQEVGAAKGANAQGYRYKYIERS